MPKEGRSAPQYSQLITEVLAESPPNKLTLRSIDKGGPLVICPDNFVQIQRKITEKYNKILKDSLQSLRIKSIPRDLEFIREQKEREVIEKIKSEANCAIKAVHSILRKDFLSENPEFKQKFRSCDNAYQRLQSLNLKYNKAQRELRSIQYSMIAIVLVVLLFILPAIFLTPFFMIVPLIFSVLAVGLFVTNSKKLDPETGMRRTVNPFTHLKALNNQIEGVQQNLNVLQAELIKDFDAVANGALPPAIDICFLSPIAASRGLPGRKGISVDLRRDQSNDSSRRFTA